MTETHKQYRSPHFEMLDSAGYFEGIEPGAIPHRDYLFFKMTAPLRIAGRVGGVERHGDRWRVYGWFLLADGKTERALSFALDPAALESDDALAECMFNMIEIIDNDRRHHE